ncbi:MULTISPECIES: S-layer homology domain-containing protein [Bacillus]|uniref:S-layer homology domain-containing protein n=1 Tax=Bacillus TaxID=1386 RepID=UPI0002D6BA91|nr:MULTISPECIES: S-layer homology domain-containing protein [Bacillus]
MSQQKKSFSKFLATAATTTIVASAFAASASAASFTDVTPKYKEAVDFVVSKGVAGYSDGTFGVSKAIKRAEAAVMLAKVLEFDIKAAPASGFKDVPKYAVEYVNALKEAGITSGKSETTFGSDDLITRGELAIWIQKGFKLTGSTEIPFTDVNSNYKEAVSALVSYDITSGISKKEFGTTHTAKRGDYAIFLNKAAKVELTSK